MKGFYKDPEYRVYWRIKGRCYDTKRAQYPNYGGRGITVCDRWLHGEDGMTGYECFLADMGRRPTPKHELDRYPDNNGNYEPSNCRWTTHKENNLNKRTNHIVTAFGETKTLTEWGIDPRCLTNKNTVLYRIRLGWPAEEAITTPLYGKYHTSNRK